MNKYKLGLTKIYFLFCILTLILAGSYKLSEVDEYLLSDECKVCDFYSSCINAEGKQRGGSSCDDNNGQCRLAGSLCRPQIETKL